MCWFGKKKDKSSEQSGVSKAADVAIKGGNKLGMQSVMQQTLLAGLPDSLGKMIVNLEKKLGSVPNLEMCKIQMHGNKGFMSSVKLMGVDVDVVDGVLEDAYNKYSKTK